MNQIFQNIKKDHKNNVIMQAWTRETLDQPPKRPTKKLTTIDDPLL